MPEFTVAFERPVTYLPDSRLHRREVSSLRVHAPDAQAALVHAVRVTVGDPGALQVVPVEEPAHA